MEFRNYIVAHEAFTRDPIQHRHKSQSCHCWPHWPPTASRQVVWRLFQMFLNAVLFALLQISVCLAVAFDGISMPIAATGPLAPWVRCLVRRSKFCILTVSHSGVPRLRHHSAPLLQLRAFY